MERKKEDISKEIEEISKSDPVVTHNIAKREEHIAKSVAGIPVTIEEMEERKKKVINFLKQPHIWVLGLLIIALVLGIYIRSMPMQDHGGNPGLWDITTNTWTLGPDLDPWLFLRTAETMIHQGSIPQTDVMRNIPLGFDNSKETQLLSYMIVLTYKISELFYSETNIEFAGAVFPVIMFALTIISFFLFVREIFVRKSKKSKRKANIISLISTFFMIVNPIFLSRTVAGIPEKESAAFFFMFLSLYLFLKAWKSKKLKTGAIFGILSGISTMMMGLIWGGVIFIYILIALATFTAFILNKVHKKEFLIYSLWILIPLIATPLISGRFSFVIQNIF
jgi:asparagine N-glycosylation enzyme membrane subunit Stt3